MNEQMELFYTGRINHILQEKVQLTAQLKQYQEEYAKIVEENKQLKEQVKNKDD